MSIQAPGPSRTLACPVCGKAMEIVVKSGVPVDRCPEHGIWLDRGEFDGILRGAHARKRRATSAVSRSAKNQGRTEGALLGWFAFLLD